jgi:hypothetical protein
MNAVIYIHGKGGSATESVHYIPLFPDCEVIGLDYQTFSPWDTGKEIYDAVKELQSKYLSLWPDNKSAHLLWVKKQVENRGVFPPGQGDRKGSPAGKPFIMTRNSLLVQMQAGISIWFQKVSNRSA